MSEHSYSFPDISLLAPPDTTAQSTVITDTASEIAERLMKVFADFSIDANVTDMQAGPLLTRYIVNAKNEASLKKLSTLKTELALFTQSAFCSVSRADDNLMLFIDLPNTSPVSIRLSSLVATEHFQNAAKSVFPVGVDIMGAPVFADLARLPHLLVGGQTGTGKSVFMHSLLASLLLHASPDDVRLLLVDTKRVEFTAYDGIPHLLSPVITDARETLAAFTWLISEMNRRYDLLQNADVSDLDSYNARVSEAMPRIIAVVDEIADLVRLCGKRDWENAVVPLLQKSRAAGIHLVLGTQRPTADVLTKALLTNIPARIAFRVPQRIDSVRLLEEVGAESLLPVGDILYRSLDSKKRVHVAFIGENETNAILAFLRASYTPLYDTTLLSAIKATKTPKQHRESKAARKEREEKQQRLARLLEAALCLSNAGKVSTSFIQRKFGVGYGAAANILADLEKMGVLSEYKEDEPRTVLLSEEEICALFNNLEEE